MNKNKKKENENVQEKNRLENINKLIDQHIGTHLQKWSDLNGKIYKNWVLQNERKRETERERSEKTQIF